MPPIAVRKLTGTNGHNPTSMVLYGRANVAGGGAGQSVSTDLTTYFQDAFGNGILPGDATLGRYFVGVTASQPAIVSVTSKSNSGFNVVLTPPTASATISAGTFDVHVMG
jgi:hypothetical protein